MKKASLEELLLPSLQPETMHYPGGVYRWSDDTLPVVYSQTATQRYTKHLISSEWGINQIVLSSVFWRRGNDS